MRPVADLLDAVRCPDAEFDMAPGNAGHFRKRDDAVAHGRRRYMAHVHARAHGALAGLEGTLVQIKNRTRLIVSVTLLQRSIQVEIDSAAVAPLR